MILLVLHDNSALFLTIKLIKKLFLYCTFKNLLKKNVAEIIQFTIFFFTFLQTTFFERGREIKGVLHCW